MTLSEEENDFVEIIDDDLVEIINEVENNHTREEKVLLVLPDNKQRLITFELPQNSEKYIAIQGINALLNEEFCLNAYKIDGQDLFDYIVEVKYSSSAEKADNCNNNVDILEYKNESENQNFELLSCVKDKVINEEENMEIEEYKEIEIEIPSQEVRLIKPKEIYVECNSIDKSEIEVEKIIVSKKNACDGFEEFLNVEEKASITSKPSTIVEKNQSKMQVELENVSILDIEDSETEMALPSTSEIDVLTIYPLSQKQGAISINTMDYSCLNPNQYLNDVIIDFYLKYLELEVLSPIDRNRTHVFSSHFYTRLANPHFFKNGANTGINLAKERHKGVQRWTKNINIFEKDFIIIPINEYSHWYVAIICFPNLVHSVGTLSTDCFENKNELQKPCILIFDSITTNFQSDVVKNLRDYLYYEYFTKIQEEKIFSNDVLTIIYPLVPKQLNDTDCGLYLLQFVENFFKDPIKDYTLPFKNLENWFTTKVIMRKREEIANLISKLCVEYAKDKDINLPDLNFNLNKKDTSEKEENDSLNLTNDENLEANTPIQKQIRNFSPKVKANPSMTRSEKIIEMIARRRNKNNFYKNQGKSKTNVQKICKNENKQKLELLSASDKNTAKSCSSKSDKTDNFFFSVNTSLDPFYNMSFKALKNDFRIVPKICNAKFKKIKKL